MTNRMKELAEWEPGDDIREAIRDIARGVAELQEKMNMLIQPTPAVEPEPERVVGGVRWVNLPYATKGEP